MIEDAFNKDLDIRIIDPSKIGENKLLCTVNYLAGGDVPEEAKKQIVPYQKKIDLNKLYGYLKISTERLSISINAELFAYIPICTSPLQGITALFAAALDGKLCVDADCCGRAPGFYPMLLNITNITPTPLIVVTPLGEIIEIKKVAGVSRPMDICKFIHMISGGTFTTLAGYVGNIKEYKKAIVPNQITKCIEIGKAVRIAREEGKNTIDAFIKKAGAHKLFEGKVVCFERVTELGYSTGNWLIDGLNRFVGHKLKIWFRNGNMICWLDNIPYVMAPDLICIVDADLCKGLSNKGSNVPEYKGKRVVVLGLPAYKLWKTPTGLNLWNLKQFGYEIEYKSIDEIELE